MREILLKPIKETTEDYERLESYLNKWFREHIYFPVLAELGMPKTTIENALATPLIDAIRTGRVQFNRGRFTGKFNAAISKELKGIGAVWDARAGSFKILAAELPPDVWSAVGASESRFARVLANIDRKLSKILPEEIAGKVSVAKIFDRSLWKVEKEFQKSVSGITVAPQLTDAARARVAGEWESNMQLWVKKFSEEQIKSLRQDVKKSVFAGNRREFLLETIQDSYGVSENKARFLARQETNLLMAKFKETRYADAGVNEYKWGCVAGSANHPVRPWHKSLEGKVFKWDDPPITTEPGKAVRRNNPGQDYNCRCYARPVVRFK